MTAKREFSEKSVSIDPLDLNREFVELPARLAYWNAKLSDATRRSMVAKHEWELEAARCLLTIKGLAKVSGEKLTVGELDARVLTDPDVQDAQVVFIEAEAERYRLKGIVGSLLTKKDMLQSLGAKLRVEMAADPVLREQLAGSTGIDLGRNK